MKNFNNVTNLLYHHFLYFAIHFSYEHYKFQHNFLFNCYKFSFFLIRNTGSSALPI